MNGAFVEYFVDFGVPLDLRWVSQVISEVA